MADSVSDLLNRADESVQDGDLRGALICYDHIFEIEPDNVGAMTNKGVTMLAMGRPKEAALLHKTALEMEPGNFDVLLNMGAALHSLNEYDAAIRHYDLALRIDSRSATALAYKALSLAEQGRTAEALATFERSMEADGDYDLPRTGIEAIKRMNLRTW